MPTEQLTVLNTQVEAIQGFLAKYQDLRKQQAEAYGTMDAAKIRKAKQLAASLDHDSIAMKDLCSSMMKDVKTPQVK